MPRKFAMATTHRRIRGPWVPAKPRESWVHCTRHTLLSTSLLVLDESRNTIKTADVGFNRHLRFFNRVILQNTIN